MSNTISLSVVIPAHNEEGSIKETIESVSAALQRAAISYEIIVINDHSTDGTAAVLEALMARIPTVHVLLNGGSPGYGRAVATGLDAFRGDYVVIMMADHSDDPEDMVRFWKMARQKGCDCVFGSRFMPGGKVLDYPKHKLVLNRFGNNLVRLLFHLSYNDCTNAFKLYSKETISGLRPFLSAHFNLTLELPLKAIIRGYSYQVVPNSWRNRKAGISKLKIREMGSRYLFILLYCLIERHLSRGDFQKKRPVEAVNA